ncbi:MAG TPA: methylated-DNA--[protein]-cysteine S-methyltransferase [Allosphingosinicella sp.]|nr:methylated-DNA--[protein]-cysteine S-methyltransferase [Allosphingosinicella sp.]
MDAAAFATFETPLGDCAIVWRGQAVVATFLPDPDLARRVRRRFPEAREESPPPVIRAGIEQIVRLLSGEPASFAELAVDLSAAAPFERDVYRATSAIPSGEVRTYGEIAQAIGDPGAARAVGRALARNPVPVIVPCHRVLAAGGGSGGFSAPGGTATKFRILEIERARRGGDPGLFADLPLAVRPAG